MSLDTRLAMTLAANQTSPLDLISRPGVLNYAKTITLLNGTGANQADRMFTDQRTIAASGTDTLDLAGTLLDIYGDVLTFAKLKLIMVYAATANINNTVVTRPASNGVPIFSAAGDACPVKPGGMFLWVAPDAGGITVTAATGDLIDIVNSAGGTSVLYDVVLIGASA